MDRCRLFVEDPAPEAQLSIGAYTLTKLKRCFSVFKAMVLDGRLASGGGSDGGGSSGELLQLQRKIVNGQENSGGGVTKPGTENKGELGGQVRCTHKWCYVEDTLGPRPGVRGPGYSGRGTRIEL